MTTATATATTTTPAVSPLEAAQQALSMAQDALIKAKGLDMPSASTRA